MPMGNEFFNHGTLGKARKRADKVPGSDTGQFDRRKPFSGPDIFSVPRVPSPGTMNPCVGRTAGILNMQLMILLAIQV